MKAIFFVLNLFVSSFCLAQNSVGIGTDAPHPSAILDIIDTSRGLLIPRMTTAQRNAIPSPANGLQIFQTDGQTGIYCYEAGTWNNLAKTAALSNYVTTGTAQTVTGVKTFSNNLFVNGNLGIGTTTTGNKLAVNGGILAAGPGTAPANGVMLSYETTGGKLQSYGSRPLYINPEANNVGIGTTSVTNKLSVNGGIMATGPGTALLGSGVVLSAEATGGKLQTYNSQPLFLNPEGNNVGIGTTNPTEKLVVNGNAITNGNLVVNGNISYTGTLAMSIQYVTESFTLPGGYYAEYFVGCPVGTKLIGGGGGHRDNNAAQYSITINYSGPHPNYPN